MFPRVNRLQKRGFAEFFKKGEVFNSNFISCRAMRTPLNNCFSVVILKGVAKTATERNKIKRRTYYIIKKNLTSLPQDTSIIFFIRKKINFKKIEKEISDLILKIKKWRAL